MISRDPKEGALQTMFRFGIFLTMFLLSRVRYFQKIKNLLAIYSLVF